MVTQQVVECPADIHVVSIGFLLTQYTKLSNALDDVAGNMSWSVGHVSRIPRANRAFHNAVDMSEGYMA